VSDLKNKESFLLFASDELQQPGLTEQMEFRKINTWSSLNALLFIARINEESEVLISAADLASCKTLGDIHALIVNRT